MKRRSPDTMREAFRQVAKLPQPRTAESFWAEFRVRAALVLQESASRPRVQAGPWSWGVVAAGVAAAAAAVVLFALLPREAKVTGPVVTLASAPAPPVPAGSVLAPLSTVEQVEVFAEYRSVMIVEDAQHGGTLIWVASAH